MRAADRDSGDKELRLNNSTCIERLRKTISPHNVTHGSYMSPICPSVSKHPFTFCSWFSTLLTGLSTLLLKWCSAHPMEREFLLSFIFNAAYTYFLSLYSYFPTCFWVLDHPIASLWPQKEELMNHPARLGLVSCSWFFSLNIKAVRPGHLEYPRTQHYRTWLQVVQRAMKPLPAGIYFKKAIRDCVQSQASQCAVLHTWMFCTLRCVASLATERNLRGSTWKNQNKKSLCT